jgi:rfaE bifunctional protein nucleotidyltransferase chain/domain
MPLTGTPIPELARKLHDADSLQEILEGHRKSGRRIIFTNGCFDILHPGHVRYLRQARDMGDLLVVGLNSDASVRLYKGPDRPVNPQDDRAEVLSALEMVDYVVIFDERTPRELILKLRPHVQVKGGDYTIGQIPEASAVASYGGEVVIVPLVEGKSTTGAIERIRLMLQREESGRGND